MSAATVCDPPDCSETHRRLTDAKATLGRIDQNQGAHMKSYYRADVQGLNPGDPATRTSDPQDGTEYTCATTRFDAARGIAARHADFCVYHLTLDEPIEADPDVV
jgi:hypothetical protein